MHLSSAFVSLSLSATFASAAMLDAATFANTSFDFIIAGGGTAGTVVATRLAEISNFTVGIIEAGGYKPDDDMINVPMGWNTGPTWGNPDYDWMYYTKPQKNLANRMINIVRGKVLGGSSALNLMGVFLAGDVEYDQLTTLGNEGWDSNSVTNYFKKATNISAAPQNLQNGEHATYNPKNHGTTGPIHISFSHWFSSAIPPFYDALVKLGVAPAYDAGDGEDSGDVWCPPLGINQETGHRSYAAVEYYAPNSAKPNLHLITGAHVTKIDLSTEKDANGNLRANGVTYLDVATNQTYTAIVNKDVIVSGGAINSPQILELSGIGNSDLLKSVGIDTKIDLPAVGENYRDHTLNYMGFTVDPTIMTWDWLADPTKNASLWDMYQTNMSGPYDSSVSAITYLSATDVIGNKTLQSQWLQELDQQFNATNPTDGQRKMYQIERARLLTTNTEGMIELYAAPSNPYPEYSEANQSYIQIASVVSHPFSRGSIHINTSDALAHPEIDMNAWALDIDKHLLVAAANFSRKVATTAPLNETITGYSYPGANVSSDAQWEEYLAENIRTPFHPCCTVSMLPQEDGGAVSNKLMVYGTSNLRVVDASVFPSQFATHLSGTVYAFAEQAADIVKAAWGH